jgi:predicted nucleic acid-binding protein
MIAYLDTSALVKKYIHETGTFQVQALWRDSEGIATSVVAFAETMCAFQRRSRESRENLPDIRKATRAFRSDWQGLLRIEVSNELNDRVSDLVERHPLRGFDAIHLASALVFMDTVDDDLVFVCADEKLTAAARQEGLPVFPESWV